MNHIFLSLRLHFRLLLPFIRCSVSLVCVLTYWRIGTRAKFSSFRTACESSFLSANPFLWICIYGTNQSRQQQCCFTAQRWWQCRRIENEKQPEWQIHSAKSTARDKQISINLLDIRSTGTDGDSSRALWFVMDCWIWLSLKKWYRLEDPVRHSQTKLGCC